MISISRAPQPSSFYGFRSERLNLEIYKERMSSNIPKVCSSTQTDWCVWSAQETYKSKAWKSNHVFFLGANALCERNKSKSDDDRWKKSLEIGRYSGTEVPDGRHIWNKFGTRLDVTVQLRSWRVLCVCRLGMAECNEPGWTWVRCGPFEVDLWLSLGRSQAVRELQMWATFGPNLHCYLQLGLPGRLLHWQTSVSISEAQTFIDATAHPWIDEV